MKEPIVTKGSYNSMFTLDDYAKHLNEATRQFAACKVVEDLMRQEHLADMLAMGYVPPTKWQRLKYRMQNIGQRFKDIWTIVSGGDIHKDCGY